MKHLKLFFALFAMLALSVGNAWGAALGSGYEKVTNISSLTTGDKVVLYCDDASVGVTGWGGSNDATVAASGFVEYLVTVVSGGVTLKDENAGKYIAKPTGNHFKYNTTAGTCSVNTSGVITCNSRYLYKNGTYYRMYADKSSDESYKPFYVYKVVADAGGDDTEDLGDALKWSTASATVQVGADDNEYPTLTNEMGVNVTYSSSSAAVATIDANGVVTLVKEGTTTISAFYEGGEVDGVTYSAKTVSYTLTVKPAPLVIEPIEGGIIDILTHKTLAATSNSYTSFTGKQATNENHSDAVYAGSSARNGNATQYSIQLNTPDKKGRIATTTSGGIAKRVYVKWSTQATLNTNARALNIYGSNDAFTGSETAAPSTKIGTITFTTGAAEAYVDLTGDYKYILMTGSGAIYMDEIQVTWVVAEGTVTTPTISGETEFVESTEVSIATETGYKVYYTLDGTDPTNASTEYTAPFTVSATTTVKAVAYDGEKASDIASQTFKKLQILTCEEAADACKSTESADKYVIRGYVTNVKYAYNEEYKTATFWIADTKDGGQVLQAYSAKPVAEIDKAVKVGDYVEAIGNLKLYNETPEITNGTYTMIPAPVVNHTITVSANPAEAGTVTGGGEFEETDEITIKAVANEGYEFVNWTENEVEVSTAAEYTFEVLADRNLVANFKKKTYTVIANATNGTVTGAGTYNHGEEVTLTATPAFDYQFVNWTKGEEVVSTDNPLTITVAEDVTLKAIFAEVAATEKKESGVFSISAHKTATFATGNLQYNVGTDTWRFAKQQYQVVGEQNIQLGHPDFTGWIDMLGWSNGEANNYGVNPSNKNEYYAGEFVDWGTKMGAEWSTLSADDWKYLLNTRANAADLKQVAKVGTMVGILLFPDAWTMPEGCTVEAEKDEYFNVNIYNYTIAQWNEMEAAGAVFLPAAGRRTGGYGNKINYDQVEETDENNLNGGYYRHQDNTNIYCYYWTSTINAETKNVSYLHNIVALGNDEYTIGTGAVWGEKGRYGQSVRLAKVVYDKHTVNATAENGTVEGADTYEHGTEVTLTATANEGYEFVNWTVGEETIAENPYKFTVTADVALVANFAKKTYTVTATAENGSVEGLAADGKYEHGATATLTATPAFDYEFVNWTVGEETITENPLTITVTDNVTLEANFAEVGATEVKESGVFSISAHKTATFATGNLQYNVGTQTWRFAKQQYQVVGEQNIQLGHPDFTGWIDMLGYSADGKFGVNPSNANADYAEEFVDWGTLFPEEGWSTLSKEDWKYLLEKRTNAANLQQVAKVGDILGIMLFPDGWVMPEDCNPTPEINHDPDDGEETKYDFTTQNYTLEQWTKLEQAGAVFLPAAGRRTGGWGNTTLSENVPGGVLDADGHYKHFDNCNEYAYYWTSTKVGENVNYLINCRLVDKPNNIYSVGAAHVDWAEKGRYGQSVRLAKVVYDKHDVTVITENGTVTGAGTYEHGATATLTAAPAEHYVFVNWTKGEEVVAETAEYTFTVEADVELVVNFKLDSHTVAATAENGTVTGADTYEHGTEVTLTATAAEGYEFVNWTSGETVVSTENPYKFTVTADVALVANFEKVVPATETVYFINTKKWSAVKAHAWGGKATGTNWPGLATIKETEKIANNDVYSFTANVGDYANIIFNNNNQGSQTPDLVWTAGKYYVMDMGWLTKEEAEAKLAAPLPEVWNVVGDAGLMGKGWDLNAAEHAMTKQADGTYKLVKTDITITAGTYEYKAAKDHDWAVAVPQTGNQKLTISKSGIYDITFVLNVTAKTLKATTTLKKEAVVIPTVIIAGDMNSWDQTKDKFTMSADSLTATFKATLAVKNYGFKMIVGGAWHSDGKTITRAANSTKFTGANSDANSTLKADVAGEYLFTWEYATKTLTVTYPARIYNINATAENGTVEGVGTYEHGDTITLIATPATGYKFRNWTTADGVVVSTEATYTFIATEDVELIANFYHETTIHCVPAGDLAWYLGQALPGDTLLLADGTYDESGSIDFNKENIVVMAAEGAKPVIALTGVWTALRVSASTTFDGITFDGTNVANYIIATLDSVEMDAELTITNCEFKNWEYWAISNQYANNVSVRSVVIDNCLFHDGTGAAIRFSEKAPEGKHACEYLKVTNTTIYNIVETSYAGIIQASSNNEATDDQNKVLIDHVTIANFDAHQLGALVFRKTENIQISNSIIVGKEDSTHYAVHMYEGKADNVLYYNSKLRTDKAGVYTKCDNTDPMFVDAANGNFALMPLSPARGAATDDSDLGDPRWYTSVNKYTVNATANPAEAGTVSGAGEYIEGVEVTLVATPERGYSFVNWTVEGEEVSTEATYTFTPSANIELVANFEEIEFTGNIINVEPGAFTLSAAIEAAQPGDMIVLADGEYSEEWSLKFDKAGLIVKAAEGARPVVKIGSYMQHYATTTIIGVTFDGKFSEEKTAEHGIYSYENTSKSLTLIDCEIKNIRKYIISTGSDAHVDSLVIDGCLLHDCGAAAIYMQSQSKLPDNLPVCSYFSMINSTVYNISGTEYYGAIDIEEHEGAKGAGGTEVLIDHVTLYNFTTPQGGIRVHKSPNTTITNTIVANPTATVGTSFYVYGGTVSNSLQFNCEKRSSSSINYVDIITADPMFTHAEHGIFCLQEGSPAIGAATDGTNLGDPRWNTPHYLVELSVLNPDHGTVEGAGVYKEGETVTVVAYAKPDYKFAAWIDNNYVNEEVTDRIYSFEITGDVNLQAEFEYEEGAQGDATDIENNIISNSQVMKVIQNGRLFIIREGKIYNAQGQVVK